MTASIQTLKAALLLFPLLLPLAAPAGFAAEDPLKAFRRLPPGKSPKKSPKKSEIVVAEVNGRKITLAAVEEYLLALPPEVGLQAMKNPRRFLKEFVQTELLFQEALRRKVDILPEVQSRILLSRRQILIDELVKRLVGRTERVSKKETRRFFRKNRARFQRKESVRLSHIVLKSEKAALHARSKLKRGVPFEEVARKLSVFESSRRTGGRLGVIRRGEIDKNLEKAAFSLPIGRFSKPIKTPVGWQIIRVIERTPASKVRLEDVEDNVRNMISRTRRQAEYRFLLERLRRGNKIFIYPERLR